MAQMTRNDTATIGATSTQIAPARVAGQRRNWLVITNTSSGGQNITIALGDSTATAGSGILLAPGGQLSVSNDPFSLCWQGAVQAIASGANGTIGITENIEV